jgi:GT2 family glycosyltransferase
MTPEAQLPRAVWLGWDGTRLHWRVDGSATPFELRLDGVAFEPRSDGSEHCAEFPSSPSGNGELEFALHEAGGRPLAPVWRVLAGRAALPGVDQWHGTVRPLQPLPDPSLPQPDRDLPPVVVIVPIFNSTDLVRRCIDAVLRWTPGARLILIDDASTDAGIAPLLRAYAGLAQLLVRTNPQNLGFTRTCNSGIALAGQADVVLLNADTEVGPRWLERLRLTAHGDAAIGTVTAVSDNAGAFSVPELERFCPIPSAWGLPQAQRALLQQTYGCLPELPTGNGFCMYIKRAMLDRVGVLDAEAFPSGYGEENDLCQRAELAGFRHVIAGDVFVRHARSASFGEERRLTLGARGMAVLRTRYPDYESKVGATLFTFARRVLDYRVRRLYAAADAGATPPRPRVLTMAAVADAVARPEYEWFAVSSARQLHRAGSDGALALVEPAVADAANLRRWLVRYAIEAVYLPPDAGDCSDLRAAARSVAVPVVEALADLGVVAPTGDVP